MIAEVVILGTIFTLYPLYLIYIIYRDQRKISTCDPEFKRKFHYLTDSINSRKTWYAKYFIPILILRRYMLLMIPAVFDGRKYF